MTVDVYGMLVESLIPYGVAGDAVLWGNRHGRGTRVCLYMLS